MTTNARIKIVKYKSKIIFNVILQITISFSIPWLNQIIIDDVLLHQRMDLIWKISFSYIFFAVLSVYLHIVLPKLMIKSKEEISMKLRIDLIKKILDDEISDYPISERGKVITLLENDINRISDFLIFGLKDILSQILSLLVTITILFYVDWRIGIISIAVIPFYGLLPMIFKPQLVSLNTDVQNRVTDMNSLIQDILSGIIQIRIFNKQKHFLNRLKSVSTNLIDKKTRYIVIQKLASATIIIYWLAMLLVLWIGGYQVLNGSLTIGVLLVLINYIDRIEWPVSRVSEVYSEYQSYLISRNRLNVILEKESKDKLSENLKNISLETIDQIRFDNLTFSYPNSKKNTFKNIDICLNKGDSICFVGDSGTGKSTLLKLLFGFHQATEGNIYINGSSIDDVNLIQFREKVGYLSQESYLFEMSLLDNILIGSVGDDSEDEVILAAQRAGAHSFITELDNGYQTIYGKDGVDLSLGQKQRIALSRIFLRNPDVIILDEPTSSLDKKNTDQIIDSIIHNYGDDKIVVLITHNVESISKFNKILKIDNMGIETVNEV
ncbi:ABC transporter ATP-binding protein [Enterococcus lemanii]|uniref:ABC transporter ATP-binding protein n=1 Tax=Enterococcus lemanii TaxID=1159752 RepID=A0ABV9MTF5_9ENTE|nr:ABC transporter ATP-binding protein [Enterococcus lemanii]MBM7709920.1 ABC-type bacteriocin/lantibiotic exporter with double-glycine peptidase domain [Enterococcus lemanii]